MTANDSSSSATSPPDPGASEPGAPEPSAAPALRLDLLASGRLSAIPSAFLRGERTELLAPLRFLAPGADPDGAAPAVDRSEVAAALGRTNDAYGHPEASALAERLADPATRVVVTGQQAGLFGGPLYTLSKIVAAVRWAERLSAAGQPAVAVFWMATEDHDFDEVARATLLGRKGPVKVDLGEDTAPLMPAGMRGLGPPLEDALEAARAAYPGDLASAAWDDIARRYRPEARFGEAFSRFVVDLLGARAPLVLDSMDATVKRLQRPHLRRLVERRHALLDAQAAAHAAVEAAGLPLQVAPQPGASPLFFLHGMERRRILYPSDDTYALRGHNGSEAPIAALLETIDENPSVISPGVLARPAIQDALLGTTLQILGPGEMSYMPQVTPAYRALEIEAPWTSVRPQVLVLERRQVEQLAELGIGLEALLETDAETLVASQLGEDLVGPAKAKIDAVLDDLKSVIHGLDPTLDRPYEKTADQIARALDTLEGKVTAATARRHDIWLKRLEKIRDQVLPDGSPQERTLAVAHFAVKYGPPFVEAMFDQLDLDPRELQVVVV